MVIMLASHCPKIDTRWPYKYEISNFGRGWHRTWSTVKLIVEASTIPLECHTMPPEPHAKETRNCGYLLRSLPEWDTKVTHRLQCVRTRSRRLHLTSQWYKINRRIVYKTHDSMSKIKVTLRGKRWTRNAFWMYTDVPGKKRTTVIF